MLQVTNLEKNFGDRTLFRDVSFTLTPGERLALVGRNGTGKSTLFRLILGEESPDKGEIVVPRGYRVGHLSQHLHFSEPNILREACRGLQEGHEAEEYRAEIILSGLGFSIADFERPASAFSGGFQIRVELARVLLSEPNLLLLDEPTNYLDIVSARWLEGFLRDWSGEMMMISHDRSFLDAVSTHTMILHRGNIRRVSGGTAKLYEMIAQDETIYEQTRLNQEKKKKEMEQFIAKFKAKAGTAALAQSRQKMLDKMDIGDELQDAPELNFTFTSAPFYGRTLIEADNLSFAYPGKGTTAAPTDILNNFTLHIRPGDRIGVIGKNGKGKSTLLRLLANELSPNQGEVRTSPNTVLSYFGQTNIQRLSDSLTVEEEIFQANQQFNRTVVRAICGTMMFSGDDALKKIKVLSGGERSRVLLGKILARPSNLLLLDEPTNHLDIESVAALVESLEHYEGAVVLVTHDEYMLEKLAKRLVLFSDEGVRVVEGDYDYFMSTIGWGDEDTMGPSSRKNKKRKNTEAVTDSEDRRSKAKNREERSRVLGPVDKEISDIEAKIVKYEADIKKYEQQLIEESSKGSSQKIVALGKQNAEAKKEIDRLFERLEALSKQRQDLEKTL